jgi:hypothetical protein
MGHQRQRQPDGPGGDKVVRFKSFRSREAALREAGIDRQ